MTNSQGNIRTLRKEDWFGSDGFPIAVEPRYPQEPFGPHRHEFHELVIVTGGQGLHVTDDDSWTLSAGDVFVIGGDLAHDYQNLNNLQLINILFDRRALALDMRDLPSLPGYHTLFNLEPAWRKRHGFESRLRLDGRSLGVAVGLVDQLDAELKSRKSGFEFMATALYMQLIGFLSRCYEKSQQADSRALLKIAESMTYLESHLTEPVKIDELAAIAGMSRRSFLRTFENATGSTPVNYAIQLKINRAASLLRSTELSVTQIAFEVGFKDSNYFSRQFRKRLGTTPSAFRRQSSFV